MCDGKKIKVMKDGPYMVFGQVPLNEEIIKKDAESRSEKWVETKKHYPDDIYALCRCGNSTNKPFCTNNHSGFDGTETTYRESFDESSYVIPRAEGVGLQQSPILCVQAKFCMAKYDVAKTANNKETLDIALEQTYNCPGGSIVIVINGEKQEPHLEKSISAIATHGDAGPLWVKGGIPVESSDGYVYEVRNRVALCRCGKSYNKPFCDSTHMR